MDFYTRIRAQWQIITSVYPWHFIGFLILAGIIPQIYILSNLFWIGRISTDALAITEQYEFIGTAMEVLQAMIPIGVLALVAQHYHNREKVIEIVKAGLILQITISLIITVIIVFFTQEVTGMIGTPIEIGTLTREYLLLSSIVFPFEAVGYILLVAIKSLQKGKEQLILVTISIVMNIVLDLFLISSTPISLQLGVPGVAIAYLLSKMLLMVMSVAYLIHILKINITSIITTTWRHQVVPLFRIGGWTGLETVVRMIGYVLILAALNELGTDEYGGFGLALSVMWMFFTPVFALGQGTSILVGNYLSEKRYGDLLNIMKTSLVLVTAFALAIAITGIVWWHDVSLFLNPNPEIVAYSDATFTLLIIGFIGFCIGVVLRSIFYGTGQTRYIFYITCITNLGMILPFFALIWTGIITPTFTMVVMVYLIVYIVDPILAFLWARKVVSKFPVVKNDAASSV